MKKTLHIIAVAALLLPSCTKSISTGDSGRAIAFQVANYATKVGISGTVFPTSESFGVYSWTDNTTGPYFMDNELVSYQADQLWKTNTTYYWPPTQTVDFFCFYPSQMSGISADKTRIRYSAYDVEAHYGASSEQQDVMYSDKAAGFADNPDNVPGSASGYSGVPVIFRHALAKLSVGVRLAYSHKEESDGTVTDWEITLNSVSLEGVYKQGDCELTLADSPAVGLVSWVKPEGAVWTPDGSVMASGSLLAEPAVLSTDETLAAVPEMFVLPQQGQGSSATARARETSVPQEEHQIRSFMAGTSIKGHTDGSFKAGAPIFHLDRIAVRQRNGGDYTTLVQVHGLRDNQLTGIIPDRDDAPRRAIVASYGICSRRDIRRNAIHSRRSRERLHRFQGRQGHRIGQRNRTALRQVERGHHNSITGREGIPAGRIVISGGTKRQTKQEGQRQDSRLFHGDTPP